METSIILIGYRGVGKTSVGRLLAEKLDYHFIDTDREIARLKGADVQEIVATEGWDGFRACEKKVLASLKSMRRAVISTGGGAVLHERQWRDLAERVFVIWLKAEEEVIIGRIKNDAVSKKQRPTLAGNSVEEETHTILRERLPLYRNLANLEVDTGALTINESVAAIEKAVKERMVQ